MHGRQRTLLLASTLIAGLAGGSTATAAATAETATPASATVNPATISAAQGPAAADHPSQLRPCTTMKKHKKRCHQLQQVRRKTSKPRSDPTKASPAQQPKHPPDVLLPPDIRWP
ncbi:hypothetical protein [Nonomuraea sp. NPDC050786]|uniref:hypothetical protein n=1 Tax=Nonomuraea sp. NPDC050786 TaxID=3154840 RepID=UPI0033D134C2